MEKRTFGKSSLQVKNPARWNELQYMSAMTGVFEGLELHDDNDCLTNGFEWWYRAKGFIIVFSPGFESSGNEYCIYPENGFNEGNDPVETGGSDSYEFPNYLGDKEIIREAIDKLETL